MNDPLLSLAPFELRALATSIRAGRLAAPYSTLNLQRIIGKAYAGDVGRRVEQLAASGMSAEALANCLDIAAAALASRPQLENLVDLVTTGPEADGVANRSTAVVVSELFRSAQESVLIAGYAVYQGQKVSLANSQFGALSLHSESGEGSMLNMATGLKPIPNQKGSFQSHKPRNRSTPFACLGR